MANAKFWPKTSLYVPLVAAGALLFFGVTSSAFAQRPFDGQTLRVMFWSGEQGRSIIQHVVEPFQAQTGARVIIEHGRTGDTMAKVRAQKASPQLDIALFDDVGVLLLGQEGLLDTIDLSRLPNSKDVYPRAIFEGEKGKVQGVGIFQFVSALLYNPQLVKEPPTSWGILWDEKYKGKVQVPSTRTAIAFFIAIGAARLNGGDEYRMAPAWDALSKLKPNLHSLVTNETVTAEMFKSNELAVVGHATFLFKNFIEKGYPIRVAYNLKEGVFGTVSVATIVKGHQAKDDVIYDFINRLLDPEVQRKISTDLWTGPTNRKVVLPPSVSEQVIDSEEEWKRLLLLDLENYQKNRAAWLEQYNRALQ